jgi:glutathione peroxidase
MPIVIGFAGRLIEPVLRLTLSYSSRREAFSTSVCFSFRSTLPIPSEEPDMITFHQLTATSLDGQLISMADYAGKLVLVVNTASHCGFTPQYAGLEALYKKYAAQGLVVLGFPCNQFGKQEPGGADEIAQTCHINYGVSFPIFEKVEVNGAATHPVFRYLKNELPGVLGGRIKWNFTKFLIGRDGKPLKRFAPFTTPEKMETVILAALEI